MVEYSHIPELTQHISEAAFGLYVMAMAFTAKQKEYLKSRDDYVCQAYKLGIPHDCNGHPNMEPSQRKNECHHIIPQRYARVIGMETADFPENGILLCSNFHQRTIHPDMRVALQKYRGGNKEAFHQVGIDRDALLNEGAIYWNPEHDRRLSTRAIQLTQKFTKRGRSFPEK